MNKKYLLVFFSLTCFYYSFSQNVGIGATAPAAKLHIKGTADTTQLVIDANSAQQNKHPLIRLRNSSGADLMWIHTDDSSNIFLGYKAGRVNVTSGGGGNSFIGKSAGFSNTSGHFNTITGSSAFFSNTTGTENSAYGYQSLYFNTTGGKNTAVGSSSLGANTTGDENSAIGYRSLFSNLSGIGNTALGSQSLYFNTTGSGNTAYGAAALYLNVSGFDNTAIGYNAGCNGSTSPSNFTALGHSAGHVGSGSNTVEIGNVLITWNGGNVGWSTYSDARIKSDVREEVSGLNFITRLRPVTYYRSCKAIEQIIGVKDSSDYPGKYDIEKIKFSGFLAQEVEAAAKAAGYDFSGITAPKNDKQIYSLCYEQFVVPLVKAVQEQQQQIEALKHEIEELKNIVRSIKN